MEIMRISCNGMILITDYDGLMETRRMSNCQPHGCRFQDAVTTSFHRVFLHAPLKSSLPINHPDGDVTDFSHKKKPPKRLVAKKSE